MELLLKPGKVKEMSDVTVTCISKLMRPDKIGLTPKELLTAHPNLMAGVIPKQF